MKIISTEKLPIKMWLNDIEDGALQQAKNLANLPFAFKHIAIMPDSHQGYGMPIGGVLATKDVVVPNAVGVDIGCFDKDTEFLSENGWIKFPNWKGEKVAQYNPDTFQADFVKPLNYIKEKCSSFIKIKTKYGIDQVLSDEHRCLLYTKGNEHKVILAKNLMEKHNKLKLGVREKFACSFFINRDSKLKISEEMLRVIVMFSADGSYSRNKCVLQLKKKRKILRAKKLLDDAKIAYNESLHKSGIARISFCADIKKGLEQFWSVDRFQLRTIVDECFYWDGNQKNCFYTSKKEEADFIHYAIGALGNRAVLRLDRTNEYRVFAHSNVFVGIAGTPKSKITRIKSDDGWKYSFTVPTSFLVVRRNGNIFATGNCGMCAVKTSLTDIDTNTLKKIMGEIRKQIPVGMNKHKDKQSKSLMPQGNLEYQETYNDYFCGMPISDREQENARCSLGTLGGGNHFIEIQKGNDGHIWIMIHSGSRNLGKQVADHYNKLARELNKKCFSSVDDKLKLAFLPIDSEEGQEYLKEMNYCVEFALVNRKLMMDRVTDILLTEFGEIQLEDLINIAHNYARIENHFGENVMVHRKGATLADKNTIGIIPGSQGSKSYIVKGLGNTESFNSCSHGAGRKMGRKQAQRTLSFKEEVEKLDNMGVIHTVRGVKGLDEAPGSYKDIIEVMENQKDLVEILVELTPLAVIKG